MVNADQLSMNLGTIYENTSFEANYMNIENVKPEQLDDELNRTNYMHLEAKNREASRIPSIYRSLIVPKSRSHQPENTDSERSYINTIGDWAIKIQIMVIFRVYK